MNSLGMGIIMALKDLFSGPAKKVSGSMKDMEKQAQGTVTGFNSLQGALQAVAGSVVFQKSKELFKDLVKPAVDLEEQLLQISTFTNEGMAGMEGLREEVLKLSSAFGTTFSEQASGAFELMQSGFTETKDAFEILIPLNKLADASFTSLDTAIRAVAKIMKTYNLEASDAAHVSNALLLASRKGKIGLSELTGFMQNSIPIAENLGVGYEEVLAVLTSLTSQGVPARQAMMSLGQIMLALTENARKLDPFMKKYGDKTLENTIKNRGLINTLNAMFVDGTKSKKLFEELGIQGKSWQNLLNILGPNFEMFSKSFKELKTNKTTLDEVFDVVDSSTVEKLKDIQTSFRDMAVIVGTELLKALKPVISQLAIWSQKISVWLREHPKVAKGIGFVVAGLVALLAVLSTLAVVLGGIAAIWGTAGEAILIGVGAVVAALLDIPRVLLTVKAAFKLLKPTVGPVMTWFKDAWLVIATDVPRAWNFMVESLRAGFGKIQPLLNIAVAGFQLFKDAVVASFNAVKNSIDLAISSMMKLVKMIPGAETALNGFKLFRTAFNDAREKFSLSNIIHSRADQIKSQVLPQVGLGQEFKTFQRNVAPTGGGNANRIKPPNILQTQGAAAASPIINIQPPVVNTTVNVPKIQVSASDVIIDKKILGRIILEMQQLTAVRQGA